MVQSQQRERQQRAAVQLKHHIDEAQAGLAEKAEVHQLRAKQQAEMHAKEFNTLLDSGQNPYAVRLPWALAYHANECFFAVCTFWLAAYEQLSMVSVRESPIFMCIP